MLVVCYVSSGRVGAGTDEEAQSFGAVVVSTDLDQEMLRPETDGPRGWPQGRTALDEQRHDGEAGGRERTGMEARLPEARGQGYKDDGRHALVRWLVMQPPSRVVGSGEPVMGPVSQGRVDKLGVRVEKLAALLDVLVEERVDKRGPRRAPLDGVADQAISRVWLHNAGSRFGLVAGTATARMARWECKAAGQETCEVQGQTDGWVACVRRSRRWWFEGMGFDSVEW